MQTTVVVDILGVLQAANGAAAMAFFKTTGFLVSIPFAGRPSFTHGHYISPHGLGTFNSIITVIKHFKHSIITSNLACR